MARTSKLEITESENTLKSCLKAQTLNKNRTRINALLHLKASTYRTRSLLAEHLDIKVRTLEKWISLYVQGGLEALLLPQKRKRSPYKIPKSVDIALSKVVNDQQGGFRSYVEAQQWVASEFGLDLKYNTIREHLIRHYKTKIKSPRKSHVNKKDKAVEAFLKTT